MRGPKMKYQYKSNEILIWNVIADRPVTLEELQELISKKQLVINYYTNIEDMGIVWIDIDRQVKGFDLREFKPPKKLLTRPTLPPPAPTGKWAID